MSARSLHIALLLGLSACQPDTSNGGESEDSSNSESSSEDSASDTETGAPTNTETGEPNTETGEPTTETGEPTTETSTETGEPAEPPEAALLELALSSVKQFDFTWTAALGAEDYQLLEQADPDAELVEVGPLTEQTALSLTVPLFRRTNASYLVRACNGAGCTDSEPVEVSGTLAEAVGYFKASNPQVEARFGISVALSADGSTLAVGARSEDSGSPGINGDPDDTSEPGSGAVYIFTHEGMGVWTQDAYIKASNPGEGDGFGTSLALSEDGSTLAVGAQWEDSGATDINGDQADNSTGNAGAVYVYTRDGMGWAQEAYIKASNASMNDVFGEALALSADGDTLAIAARLEASASTGIDGDELNDAAPAAGAVFVYVREGASWSKQAYIKASNTNNTDFFGTDVAIAADGDTLAVGAFRESSAATGIDGDQTDNSLTGAGAIYVFTRADTIWSQQAYLKASNTDATDFFGRRLSLAADGNTLATTAYREDSAAAGVGGDQDDNSLEAAGAAYVFTREGMVWSQQAYIKASNPGLESRFGASIALAGDGRTLAIGSAQEASAAIGINGDQGDASAPVAGAVYVYALDELEGWSQVAYVKASNTDADDSFGESAALTGDGSVLAVGAFREDSDASGVGGGQDDDSSTDAGAVYLY